MNFTEIAVADASVEAKIEAISVVLDKKLETLSNSVSSVSQQVGPKGDRGERGLPGKDGKDGKNGRDGVDGRNGKDGVDGVDGKDGVSIIDAYIDFDGSLVIKLSDGKEINAGDVEISGQSKENVIQLLKNGALSLNELLPDQSNKNGYALHTDGSNTYWAESTGGASNVIVSATPPANPNFGDVWFDIS